MYDPSCSSSTTIVPKFLNGKNNDDLAPITILIFPWITPFQIIDLFFLVVPECQIAGSDPKNSLNLLLNWFVKAISGIRINAWKPLSIKSFILLK